VREMIVRRGQTFSLDGSSLHALIVTWVRHPWCGSWVE
jgi:hypothetical protein